MKGGIPPPSPPIGAWPDQSPRAIATPVSATIKEEEGVPRKKTPTWNIDGRFDHVVQNKPESPPNVPSAAQLGKKTDGGKVSKPSTPSKMSSFESLEESPMMVSPVRPAMVVLGQGSPTRTSSDNDPVLSPALVTFQSPPSKTSTTRSSTNKVGSSAIHPGVGFPEESDCGGRQFSN